MQYAPPHSGDGAEHERIRDVTPTPHVSEHALHGSHDVHPPSTVNTSICDQTLIEIDKPFYIATHFPRSPYNIYTLQILNKLSAK